jgi:hypothetical protein
LTLFSFSWTRVGGGWCLGVAAGGHEPRVGGGSVGSRGGAPDRSRSVGRFRTAGQQARPRCPASVPLEGSLGDCAPHPRFFCLSIASPALSPPTKLQARTQILARAGCAGGPGIRMRHHWNATGYHRGIEGKPVSDRRFPELGGVQLPQPGQAAFLLLAEGVMAEAKGLGQGLQILPLYKMPREEHGQ